MTYILNFMETPSQELDAIVSTIEEEEVLSNKNLDLTGNYKTSCCLSVFYDLQLSITRRAKWMIDEGDVFMASLVSRTAIENLADMNFYTH